MGEALSLTVSVADRLDPDWEREPVDAGVTWFTHQGPAVAEFDPAEYCWTNGYVRVRASQ